MEGLGHSGELAEGGGLRRRNAKLNRELFLVPSISIWIRHQLPCIGQQREGLKAKDISPSLERYNGFYQKASDFKEENIKTRGNIKMNKIRGS